MDEEQETQIQKKQRQMNENSLKNLELRNIRKIHSQKTRIEGMKHFINENNRVLLSSLQNWWRNTFSLSNQSFYYDLKVLKDANLIQVKKETFVIRIDNPAQALKEKEQVLDYSGNFKMEQPKPQPPRPKPAYDEDDTDVSPIEY